MGATTFQPGATQQVSLSTSTAQSAALGAGGAQMQVRVMVTEASDADAACYVRFGDNPTAVADASDAASFPVGLNVPEYFDILAGWKIAGILSAGTAKLNVTVLST